MTRHLTPFVAIAMLVGFVAGGALAQGRSAPDHSVTITGAWTRPAAAHGSGVVYLTITNRGAADDTLISASSSFATRVVAHQSVMLGSVSAMRELAKLPVPAGRIVSLKPGGAHLMLEGLNRALKSGDRVPLTLTFSRAGEIKILSVVRDGGTDSMVGMHM